MGGIEEVIKNSQILINDNNSYLTLYYLIDNSYINSVNESDDPDATLPRPIRRGGNNKQINFSRKRRKKNLFHTLLPAMGLSKTF